MQTAYLMTGQLTGVSLLPGGAEHLDNVRLRNVGSRVVSRPSLQGVRGRLLLFTPCAGYSSAALFSGKYIVLRIPNS